MNSKHKKLRFIALSGIISIIFYIVQFYQGKHMNYYIDSFSESLSLVGAYDVDINDDDDIIRITGRDPYLIYTLPEQGDYINCKVIFSERMSDAPLYLRIYYTDGSSDFSEGKTINVTVDKFSDNVCFSLPEYHGRPVKYIRLDFESELSRVPTVRFVGLQHDLPVSRLTSFLLGLIYDYLITIPILLFVFIYALAYYLQNWEENNAQRNAAFLIIMVISFCFYKFLNNNEENLFPLYDETYTVGVELEAIGITNDVEVSDHGYKIVGEDAFVTYNVEIPNGKGIWVEFENSFENSGHIQLFYAKAREDFSEDNSARVSVDAGQKYVNFPVSFSDVSAIRIDVDMAQDTEFKIDSLQLGVSNIGYIEMMFNKYKLIYLGILALIIIAVVLINRKVEYFKHQSWLFTVIVIGMLISIVLVVLMSSRSELGNHPDEYVTKMAIDYYLNHWVPPDIRSADISNTFSAYGTTRLRELTVYYFLAGKMGLIFSKLFHYTHYYRAFNSLLYIVMIGTVIYNIRKESWLIITVALTPQLWYIFSYATSDAWDFFCSFLLIYQAAAKDSILNKALEDQCSRRNKILAYAYFGTLSAFIMMGKQNYYVVLLSLFIIFLFRLFKIRTDERHDYIKKYSLILVFFGSVLLVRHSINYYYYGFNGKEIQAEMYNEHAEDAYKASTPIEERFFTLNLKGRGVTLQELFYEYGFGLTSYKSFVGVFGILKYYCSSTYYRIISCLLAMLLIAVYLSALKKKSVINMLEIFTVTIIMCLSVIFSIYHSWTSDFQPQGRYLLPMIISFSYIASQSEPSIMMEKRIIAGLAGTIQILACVAYFRYGVLPMAM